MTRVEAIRTLVLSLDDEGKSTGEIADIVGIPESVPDPLRHRPRLLPAPSPEGNTLRPMPRRLPRRRPDQAAPETTTHRMRHLPRIQEAPPRR